MTHRANVEASELNRAPSRLYAEVFPPAPIEAVASGGVPSWCISVGSARSIGYG